MKITLNELKQIISEVLEEEIIEERKKRKRKQVNKWIPTDMKSGALSRYLGIPEEENIPMYKIQDEIDKLDMERERKGYLTKPELKLLRRLYMAKNLKKISK